MRSTLNPDLHLTKLREWLRGQATATAAEVSAKLSVPPATLSRWMKRPLAVDILRLGRSRATRYGLMRSVQSHGSAWTLYRITKSGSYIVLGRVVALHDRAFAVLPEEGAPDWLTADAEAGAFDDLPWYLQDLRPQGFLGRAFVRRVATLAGVRTDARHWSADDLIAVLLAFGGDGIGDLVLGDAALAAAVDPREPALIHRRDYPARALAEVNGEPIGSSVAGEQPKFAVYAAADGAPRHVVVKFTTPRNVADARWRDLLAAEHLALDTLGEAGLTAAASRIVDVDGHRFLEVDRFDRWGARGRSSSISLTQVDGQFAGVAEGWHRAARRLVKAGVIDAASARDMERAEAFGAAIANSDRHFGNLSFAFDSGLPAKLSPIYDMLPMAFAPGAEGPQPYAPPKLVFPSDLATDAVAWAKPIARAYWLRVAADARISAEFRAIAAATAAVSTLAD